MSINYKFASSVAVLAAVSLNVIGGSQGVGPVSNDVIESQRAALASSTLDAGFGPQSPRDLDSVAGNNQRTFVQAPAYTQMNLCNIHMHEGAEHKGGDFTTYAGNGDGEGYGTGYLYDGELSESEMTAYDKVIGKKGNAGLQVADTIEVHYVHSSAQVVPGPTLASCLSESIANPQLRVETQVFVLVNDTGALDFNKIAEVGEINGKHQALNIPNNTGVPIQYEGSTTGPSYNEKGSPLQVSWSVRPQVAKVNISTVGMWFDINIFNEDHAHGVRNLVMNPDLLSSIK